MEHLPSDFFEKNLENCGQAIGRIPVGEECEESFYHISEPSSSTNNGHSSKITPSLIGVDNLSSSWIQVKSEPETSKSKTNSPNLSSYCSMSTNVEYFHPSSKDRLKSVPSFGLNEHSVRPDSKQNDKLSEHDIINAVNNTSFKSCVKLKKSTNHLQAFQIKSAAGMGIPVPDLAINNQYFDEPIKYNKSYPSLDTFYQVESPCASSKLDRSKVSNRTNSCESSFTESVCFESTPKNSPCVLTQSSSSIKSVFNFSQKLPKSTENKDVTPEMEESVRSKVIGLWNNVKYNGWTMNLKTNFSKELSVILLGKEYHNKFSYDTNSTYSDIEGFKKDFYSIIWFTYRRKFPTLPESSLNTDCGWGCMIRCGQMMFAEALRRHFLPKNWFYSENSVNPLTLRRHKRILSWFADYPSINSPFSIHNLVSAGHSMNKKAGDWYGPNCVSYMFKNSLLEGNQTFPELRNLKVYVSQDGGVYIQDILNMCLSDKCHCHKKETDDSDLDDWVMPASNQLDDKSVKSLNNNNLNSLENVFLKGLHKSHSTECNNRKKVKNSLCSQKSCPKNTNSLCDDDCFLTEWDLVSEYKLTENLSRENSSSCTCKEWKSLIVFIPVRMGGIELNSIYHSCIYSILSYELCIGIIGGRPKHALYFVGFQDDSLIHLDPHVSQDTVPFFSNEDLNIESYHCSSPRKMLINKMDPSATFGFYCKTHEDFLKLIEDIPKLASAKDGNLNCPIFEFLDGSYNEVIH